MVLTAQWRRRRPLPAGWLAGGAWGASKAMAERGLPTLPNALHVWRHVWWYFVIY
jgi:hypothetical protein